MSDHHKKILVICRAAPYGNSLARDAIDAILASSAFDPDMHVLFMDDGVWQLKQDQNGKTIDQKTISALLSAFPLYGIDQLYVQHSALSARGLDSENLCLTPKLLTDSEIGDFIDSHDCVLSF